MGLYTSGSKLNDMFIHVQGIDGEKSAKYTPTVVSAVPEPETYAMLLAGIALIGFSAHRRKINTSSLSAFTLPPAISPI